MNKKSKARQIVSFAKNQITAKDINKDTLIVSDVNQVFPCIASGRQSGTNVIFEGEAELAVRECLKNIREKRKAKIKQQLD